MALDVQVWQEEHQPVTLPIKNAREGAGHPTAWYAVFTKPHYEKIAAASLRSKGYEEFLPLYPSQAPSVRPTGTSHLPLFPRYFFCRLDVTKRLPVLMAPGVISLVSSGRRPLPVMPDEIVSVQKVIQSGLTPSPHVRFRDGQPVMLTEGPLKGIHGLLVSQKSVHRLVVMVTILGRGVSVEINMNWAVPLKA